MDMVVTTGLSTSDKPTLEERNQTEVSPSPMSEGSPTQEGVVSQATVKQEKENRENEEKEKVDDAKEKEQDKEEKEDIAKWGPFKVPVTVKIADLGNACWVVSPLVFNTVIVMSRVELLIGSSLHRRYSNQTVSVSGGTDWSWLWDTFRCMEYSLHGM